MTKTYTGIHQHSIYSVLDGYGKIDPIVAKCKELGMRGVCITDHGNMFGAYELNKACKKAGMKPIFANETYMAYDSALVKERIEGQKPAYHLILIAMNDVGYKNLMKLTSWSWTEGKYYKPRVDMTRLAQWNEGIICTSACLGGLPSQLFMEGHLEEAEDKIKEFKKIFGDRYYLELTHTGQKIDGVYTQTETNKFLVSMAEKHGIATIITSDSHYVDRTESEYHATLVDINTGGLYRKKKTTDVQDETGDGLFYEKEQYYIKSYDDLMDHYIHYHGEEWRDIIERSLEETNILADRCNVDFKEGMKIIPQIVDDPDTVLLEESRAYLLEYLSGIGITQSSGKIHEGRPAYDVLSEDRFKEYWDRLDHELEVIRKMGFSDYFHVVAEYTQWAKDNGIMVGGGRGSAAGSLVAYCMRITSVDPIEYGLLFERFLNRGRAKRPMVSFKEYTYEEYEAEVST